MLTPFMIVGGPHKGQIEYGTDKADAEDNAGAPVRALTAAERQAEDEVMDAEMAYESGADFGTESGRGTEMMNEMRFHRMYEE